MDPGRSFSRLDVVTGTARATQETRDSEGHDPRLLPMLPDPRPPSAPPAFHVLVKPSGAICNLDCTYCFFLSKEMLYPGSRFRMAEELLQLYLRQLMQAHARSP